MWSYIIPILTLIVGLIGGFFIGVYYFKKQMERMQSDPKMMADMAKKMGYNVNKQQLNKMQQMVNKRKKR